MTNDEKYLKDGVDEKDFLCDYMDFKKDSGLGFDINSLGLFLQAKVKPTLTEAERVILENIQIAGNKAECIERTTNTGYLRVYTQTRYGIKYEDLDIYSHLFQFIKNGEEYPIEELLGGE